ncbi:MAG TPA: gas vesicle protein GvpG [Solirubrobacteraceae bacterium]|nr:gas vesicle protein GvpG [Solirubrobacteraceae bacterium]
MGLITGLLTLPLAPVRGVAWVAEKVAEEADRELYDENRIMSELAALEAAHDRGEISEDRFHAGVDELLERLQIGRELRTGRYA